MNRSSKMVPLGVRSKRVFRGTLGQPIPGVLRTCRKRTAPTTWLKLMIVPISLGVNGSPLYFSSGYNPGISTPAEEMAKFDQRGECRARPESNQQTRSHVGLILIRMWGGNEIDK